LFLIELDISQATSIPRSGSGDLRAADTKQDAEEGTEAWKKQHPKNV
jgi:hypothetical protein